MTHGACHDGAVEPIRVLVVDDHALFRRGLEIVLAQEPDIEVVGEAGDGAEAVEQAADLLPDVVLMDVRMPRRSGIEACTAIKDVVPSARIIMLTISDEEGDLYEAIKAGATGYLLKEITIDEVATAIRAVAGGQSLISPSMASKLLTEFATLRLRLLKIAARVVESTTRIRVAFASACPDAAVFRTIAAAFRPAPT